MDGVNSTTLISCRLYARGMDSWMLYEKRVLVEAVPAKGA